MPHYSRFHVTGIRTFIGAVAAGCCAASVAQASPWASTMTSYDPGSTAVFGFTDPMTALGSPERFTGEGVFPSNVTLFNPGFGTDEIVSVGEGGHLTLQLDTPATNDAGHLYGVDMILFGNAGFQSEEFAGLVQTNPATMFGAGAGRIELSSDGVSFHTVPGLTPDRLFPTQGYLDVAGFSDTPGSVATNFLKPVNPALTLSSFDGLTYEQSLALYDGSGGGTPIDISLAGLSVVTHIRISIDDDFNPNTFLAAEIDAVATVPEPATMVPATFAAVLLLNRRRAC